jgi:hypothetical protein
LVLLDDLLLQLSPGLGLFVSNVSHLSLLDVLLLTLDHLLNAGVLEVILLLLHVEQLLLLSLLVLDALSIVNHFLLLHLLARLDAVLDVGFHAQVPFEESALFLLLLFLFLLLHLHRIHISLFDLHDILGLLLGVFDLLPCL